MFSRNARHTRPKWDISWYADSSPVQLNPTPLFSWAKCAATKKKVVVGAPVLLASSSREMCCHEGNNDDCLACIAGFIYGKESSLVTTAAPRTVEGARAVAVDNNGVYFLLPWRLTPLHTRRQHRKGNCGRTRLSGARTGCRIAVWVHDGCKLSLN